MNSVQDEYIQLLSSFVDGRITAAEFESEHLTRFKAETRPLDEPSFGILDRVFGDVDAFCGDDDLYRELVAQKPGWYLNADELRSRVATALRELMAIRNRSASEGTTAPQ